MQNLEKMQLLVQILDLIEKKEVTIGNLSIASGIPTSKLYSWSNKRSKPKGEDFAKLLNWATKFTDLRIEDVITESRLLPQQEKHTPTVKEITSVSLESLIQANLEQSEALNSNAKARLVEAENQKKLIDAVNKENAFNLGSALQVDRLTTAILGFVAQVAAGRRFDNEALALAEIRKLLQESRHSQGVVDIQTH